MSAEDTTRRPGSRAARFRSGGRFSEPAGRSRSAGRLFGGLSDAAGRLFGGPDAVGRLFGGPDAAGRLFGGPDEPESERAARRLRLEEVKEQERDQMHREELKTQREEMEAVKDAAAKEIQALEEKFTAILAK